MPERRTVHGADIIFRTKRMLLPDKDHFIEGEVAVRDGMICSVSVGSKLTSEERRGADLIDLGGDILAPAFYDAHMHLYQWSISRSAVDLSGARSWKDVNEKLKAVRAGESFNDLYEGSGILFGVDYDDSTFMDLPCPNTEMLDRLFNDDPVFIRRICGHIMLVNSAAREMLGTDGSGIQDGPLRDQAAMAASWSIPFDRHSIRKGLSKGIEELWSAGIAGGVEILPSSVLDGFLEDLQGCGGGLRLSLSIVEGKGPRYKGSVRASSDWPSGSNGHRPNISATEPRIVFEKHFMDGSIGSKTASFTKDYSPTYPEVSTLMDRKTLSERAAAGYERDCLPMVHAIGDRAISDTIEALIVHGLPFRIEHAEAVTGEHLKRLIGSKGCLSLQPNFQRVWGLPDGLYGQRLGRHHLKLNPFAAVGRSGIPWCFGSDMMPVGPLFGIIGATQHIDPAERLDLITAIKGYSEASSRYSLLCGNGCGRIMEGSAADLVVLSRDLERVKAIYIDGIRRKP